MTTSLAKINMSTGNVTREPEKATRYFTFDTEGIIYSLLTPGEIREVEENDR